jgi:5S rRNA maturation endonuclease (ribonuclease M5)
MLNPILYDLLKRRYIHVRICNEGEELVGRYSRDPYTDRMTLDIESWGETYCVSCPFCNDTTQRLYINHRYGVADLVTKTSNNYMARCFNEECLKRDPSLFDNLYQSIYGMLNANQRKQVFVARGTQPTLSTSKLQEAPPPGRLSYIQDLPDDHPAIEYLINQRGYDLSELVNNWNLMYCESASSFYRLAASRIIIPIIQNSMWVGWQARYVGDINFKQAKIPKYYTLPSMPKRLVLYNHDTAMKQKLVIVCEGPTSAWTMYPYGVALLGKQATIQQRRLIVKNCSNKSVIILLDEDAKTDAVKLESLLSPHIKKLARIELPKDKDPGSYYHNKDELWDLIKQQVSDQNQSLYQDIKDIAECQNKCHKVIA